MPDLSIIIVNWNTVGILVDCLVSIEETTNNLELEIIVVDNASSDGSPDHVREYFPHVKLMANTDNVGFARANNQALRVMTGRLALLLNSDTIVKNGALEAMVKFMDEWPQAGIIGNRLLNKDGSHQESWAAFPSLSSELLGKNFRTKKKVAQDTYEVDWIGGASLLIRPEVCEQIGLLDEDFFMYSEETDWCYRVKEVGWQIYYLDYAPIIHLGGGSASRASAKQLLRLYRSKIRFFDKHYGAIKTNALIYGVVGANMLGLARSVVQRKGTDHITARWQLIKGVFLSPRAEE